jgi:hypothetical protein
LYCSVIVAVAPELMVLLSKLFGVGWVIGTSYYPNNAPFFMVKKKKKVCKNYSALGMSSSLDTVYTLSCEMITWPGIFRFFGAVCQLN